MPAAALRALASFAVAMTRADSARARAALRRARAAGATRVAAEETALMLMLYAGYPAALEGLRALNTVWPGRARRSREGAPARWRAAGERLCSRVYGPAYARLVPAVRELHPDLATWMIEHGYGRVLSRPGLGPDERELVTVAALAAGGWARQRASHVLGALRTGARADEVERMLRLGAGRAGAGVVRAERSRLRRAAPRPAPRAPRSRQRRNGTGRRASQGDASIPVRR